MDRISKIICKIIVFILIFVLIAFSVFLVVNWEYISNPYLVPYYNESRSIFGHGFDDLAKYRNELFYIPVKIVTYLIIIETVLLFNLKIKNTLTLSKIICFGVFLSLLTVTILFPFYELYTIALVLWMYVLLASIVLLFFKKYEDYGRFLFVNIATVLIHLSFVVAYVNFFFI